MRALLDFFAPARCAACGAFGSDLCAACFTRLAHAALLRRAGGDEDPPIDALGRYDAALRHIVLALKYRHRPQLGVQLGAMLGAKLEQPFDVVVPVPLHAQRRCERGYNQAGVIAAGIASVHPRSSLVPEALRRSRATLPQSTLALPERTANVERAFVLGPLANDLAGARVLLVDDVATTGATLQACAAVLRRCGAASVRAACVAIRV